MVSPIFSAAAGDSLHNDRHAAEQLADALPALLVTVDRVANTVQQGVHGRRRAGVGESFWQFRNYESGDSTQLIDWRQSAKADRLFVREREWEASQTIWMWLDHSPSMSYRSVTTLPEKITRARVLLLALASLLLRGGERIALLHGDHRPVGGRRALNGLAHHLLHHAASGPSDIPSDRALPRFASVVFISDFLSPMADTENAVRSFAAQGLRGHLLHLVDPAEEDLPFSGRTQFEGLENERPFTVGRAESLRTAYRRRIQSRQEHLIAFSRRLGWTYGGHRTDHAPESALLGLYRAMADRLDT